MTFLEAATIIEKYNLWSLVEGKNGLLPMMNSGDVVGKAINVFLGCPEECSGNNSKKKTMIETTTNTELADFLERYNRWRRGDDTMPMPSPREIGDAIDKTVEILRKNTMHTIYFKRLCENAKAPERKHAGDAGWDVCATSCTIERSQRKFIYGTGIALAIPDGLALMVMPRSSVYKTGLLMCNCVGLIDSGYRGEIKAMFYDMNDSIIDKYEEGDRIFQLVPLGCKVNEVEFVEVDELPESEDGRNEGGFGSTGR